MSYCVHCGTELPAGAAACPSCGQPAPGAPDTAKKEKRFLLVVLVGCAVAFVGVAFMGIVAALVVPNFLDALQKAKQKRTQADLRRIGTAVESYKDEHQTLPVAHDIDGLARLLAASGSAIPRIDAWKRPFRYECWQADGATTSAAKDFAGPCDHYRIGSAGRDGTFDKPDLKSYGTPGYTTFDTTDYDRDLVFGDGTFITWPERSPPPSP
jgi:type II secretory pathway pseudopilin PulG